MTDNVDLKIENLYKAYQKTLAAEKTINNNKNLIYSYKEVKLPDKSVQLKRFKYNENLIEDKYVSSMDKLKNDYGKDSEGSIEKTRKHIYNLMKKIAETDSSAQAYFEEMKKQDNTIVESFGSDSNISITNVNEYTDNTGAKSNNHIGTANFTETMYSTSLQTKSSELHNSVLNSYKTENTYSEEPTVMSRKNDSTDNNFNSFIDESIFDLPK